MIKVRVTKEEIINAYQTLAYCHFPRDIIVDGELVLELVEDEFVCATCDKNLMKECPLHDEHFTESPAIEELPSIAVDEKKWSEAHVMMWNAINEIIRALNTMRK